VIAKVAEEVRELQVAPDAPAREEELGDLLFALVNLSRWLGIQAESALRGANRRFRERFAAVERLAGERGLVLGELNLEELDALWEEAKGEEIK
jgi:tetrapyrrole methylase family protein/MazG family protein